VVAVIKEAQEILAGLQDQGKLFESQLRIGDKESAGTTLKKMSGEIRAHTRIAERNRARGLSDPRVLAHFLREVSDDDVSDLEGISGAQLIAILPPELIEGISDSIEVQQDALANILLTLDSSTSGSDTNEGHPFEEYRFDESDSGFPLDSAIPNFRGFVNNPSFNAKVRRMAKEKRGANRQKMKKHFPKEHEHRHLQRVGDTEVCQAPCDL
jgi:hypothetical protein